MQNIANLCNQVELRLLQGTSLLIINTEVTKMRGKPTTIGMI